MISSISSFGNISVVFWIAASVAKAVAVNPNGTKTFLANGVSRFFN